jgi:predicted NodU family carbamoyl transferase
MGGEPDGLSNRAVRARTMSNTNILGISTYYHDSAAALLRDSKVITTAQEERLTRKKYDAGFPSHAIRYCLSEGGKSEYISDNKNSRIVKTTKYNALYTA